MIRSVSSKLKPNIEINVEHEMSNGYKKQFIIKTNSQKPFFQFVYQLDEELFSSSKWQRRAYYNNKTKIQWNELKTLEELRLTNLTIKNINIRDHLKKILQKYKTKIASSSFDKNSILQNRIRNWDIEIAQLLLISPDPEDPFYQQDEILKQQAQFYMKRKFEEDILEDQIKENQISPNIDINQNELNLVFKVLSDQLNQGDRQLIVMKNNESIQSIQLALASSGQKIYEIKINSDSKQFEELKQMEKESAFIKDFISQICKNQKFNQKDIHVLGLEKGSIIIKFLINDVPINKSKIKEIEALYEKSQIKIIVKPFFNQIGLSANNFDYNKNEDWTDDSYLLTVFNSQSKYQNNLNYIINNKLRTTGPDNNPLPTFHPKGWKAYGLNVQDKYENNKWFEEFGEGAWYKVYALICDQDLEKKSIESLTQVHPLVRIFNTKVYNKIELAEKNCNVTQKDQGQYKMIFQCRVFPEKLLVGNQPYIFAIHKDIYKFQVHEIQHIRVEKILLKNMTDSCAKFTECLKNSCSLI